MTPRLLGFGVTYEGPAPTDSGEYDNPGLVLGVASGSGTSSTIQTLISVTDSLLGNVIGPHVTYSLI